MNSECWNSIFEQASLSKNFLELIRYVYLPSIVDMLVSSEKSNRNIQTRLNKLDQISKIVRLFRSQDK